MPTYNELYDIIVNKENFEEYTNLYPDNEDKIILVFIDKFDFDPTVIESTEEKVKRKDKEFRDKVKAFYKNCVISKRSSKVCEVAHIKPFSESNPEEKYDPNNGILLSADLHKLFDLKLLTINPDTSELRLTDSVLLDEEFKDYYQYNGKILEIKSESKKYLNL